MERRGKRPRETPVAEPGREGSGGGWWVAALDEEMSVLGTLINSARRRTVLRHHLFFRHARLVHRVVGRVADVAHGEPRALPPLPALLQLLLGAGERASNEARAQHLNTAPLALALLAIFARLHALLSPPGDGDSGAAAGPCMGHGMPLPLRRALSAPGGGVGPTYAAEDLEAKLEGLAGDMEAARYGMGGSVSTRGLLLAAGRADLDAEDRGSRTIGGRLDREVARVNQ